MAVRTQERIDRARERKRQKIANERYSVVPGRSILQLGQDHLDSKMNEYLDMRNYARGDNGGGDQVAMMILRAEIKGIAVGVGIIVAPHY